MTTKYTKDKPCLYCQKPFTPQRKTARFCSSSCKELNHRGCKPRTPKVAKPCKNKNCDQLTKSSVYCSSECKESSKRSRTLQTKWQHFTRSNFGYWLASTCKRSGSVQVLKGWNAETVLAMRTLKRNQFYANGSNNGNPFHYAHLAPCRGEKHLGLFNPRNLMLARADVNLSLSNQEFGHIERICLSDTLPKWDVKASDSVADVLQLANRYLNGLLLRVAQTAPFTPAPKKSDNIVAPMWLEEQTLDLETCRVMNNTRDTKLATDILEARNVIHQESQMLDEWFDNEHTQATESENLDYDLQDLSFQILTNDILVPAF